MLSALVNYVGNANCVIKTLDLMDVSISKDCIELL